MKNPDIIQVAQNFLAQNIPDYRCAFVAGSVMRGEGGPHSDIDLVVIVDEENGPPPHRESLEMEGWPLEAFINNPRSARLILQRDINRGSAAMIGMMKEGRPIGPDQALADELQALAQKVWDKGPPPLPPEDIAFRRYFISDGVDDLRAFYESDRKFISEFARWRA